MGKSNTSEINEEKMDITRAPTAVNVDNQFSDRKAKKRRKYREGWTGEMIDRRNAIHEKLLKKRQKLTARIEYNDTSLELHEMFRPPWKRDYTVEENYQVASVNGLPILYLVVCKQCKTVHIQDKSNYNNLLFHLDKHNIEAGRPRKCKRYPTGKRWSKCISPSWMQKAETSYPNVYIDRDLTEKYKEERTSDDEDVPLSIVEKEDGPNLTSNQSRQN